MARRIKIEVPGKPDICHDIAGVPWRKPLNHPFKRELIGVVQGKIASSSQIIAHLYFETLRPHSTVVLASQEILGTFHLGLNCIFNLVLIPGYPAAERRGDFSPQIARLLEIVSETKTDMPAKIQKAIVLSDYAVKTRYPGESEPVTKEEYEEALKIAETVYNWVCDIMKESNL